MSLKLQPRCEHLQLSLSPIPAYDPEVGVLAADLDVGPRKLLGKPGARKERDPDLVSGWCDNEGEE